jgi:hypothetical protein
LGGAHKYGCFGVYDTDAKNIFLGVSASNVYSYRCARQMAVGALKNSNASFAIAVTGHSMPRATEENNLGKIHIGIAAYTSDKKIIVETRKYDLCKDIELCKIWMKTPQDKTKLLKLASDRGIDLKRLSQENNIIDSVTNGFNIYPLTNLIGLYVRNKTTEYALSFAKEFVDNNYDSIIVPSFINKQRIENSGMTNNFGLHPNNIYLQNNKAQDECINNNQETCNKMRL